MKYIILFISIWICSSVAIAQVNTVWTMRDTSDLGRGNKMVMDNTGNIYVCGKVGSSFTVSKLNPSGNILWKKQSIAQGEAFDIVYDGGSNIYVTGIAYVNNSKVIILEKNTLAGGLVWNISSEQSNNINNYSNISKDNLGNIIINYSIADSINNETEFYTRKYNSSGNLIYSFAKTIQGLGWSRIKSDNSGNVYILYNDSFIIEKLSPSGSLLWSKEFNPIGNNFASDIYVDANSNAFIIGTQNNGATANDFVTLKYNSTGVLQWSSFYNNDSVTTNNSDIGQSITIDFAGNVIVSGDSQTGANYNRKVNKTVKYDANGLEQWSVGNLHPHFRNFTQVVKTDNTGNIYVLNRLVDVPPGPPRSRVQLFKYNSLGLLMWDAQGYSTYQDHPGDILIDNSLNVYMSSGAGNPIEGFCMTVIKFGQASVGIINNSTPTKYSLSQNYPNPFNPSTSIRFDIQRPGLVKLTVFDFLGRKIKTLVNSSLQPGSYEETFDAEGLSSGIYFYRLDADGFTDTRKMILLK